MASAKPWSNKRLVVISLSTWLLLTVSSVGAESFDVKTIKQLRDRGEIVALGAILRDARRRYEGGRLLDAELEQDGADLVYEIDFLDRKGELRELYYNARTGELMAYEVYETSADGSLRALKYDAKTGAPIAFEVDTTDDTGTPVHREFDLRTGEVSEADE